MMLRYSSKEEPSEGGGSWVAFIYLTQPVVLHEKDCCRHCYFRGGCGLEAEVLMSRGISIALLSGR